MSIVTVAPGTRTVEEVRRAAAHDRVCAGAEKLLSDRGVFLSGHFDLGNGRHSGTYVNPHAVLDTPSVIWQMAQTLVDLMPAMQDAEVVAGPLTGGAMLAHSVAGVLDGQSSLGVPCKLFAPLHPHGNGYELRDHYRKLIEGKKVWLVDDVRRTNQTMMLCAEAITDAGGTLIGTAVILDRVNQRLSHPLLESVPHESIRQFWADDFPAAQCPHCADGESITRF